MPIRFRRVLTLVTTLALLMLTPALPARADAVTDMSTPLYQLVNPVSNASLVTPWSNEASSAAQHGYTVNVGTPFRASATQKTGLTAVHRLWNNSKTDFIEALANSSAYTTARANGYADQGARYYALASAVSGKTEPVNRYTKSGKHRLATASAGSALVASGWTLQGVAFHQPISSSTPTEPQPVPPAPADPPGSSNPAPSAGSAGAEPIGSTSYAIPAGALFVSTSGKDSNSGTQSAPVRTIARAVALASSGGTIVIRGGTYREQVKIYAKTLTLQNYPKETVWMDGSTSVSGWVADGGLWRKDGWTTRFDHSPTYTQGAPDSTKPYWQFVNTSTYPMAAHPDQVFIDGVAQQQVKSKSLVTAGKFYLDEATSKLYLGSNPTGKQIDVGSIIKALSIQGKNSVIRGIGIRRYSNSVFHKGSVTIEEPGVRMENVIIEDAATTGVSVQVANVTLNKVTVRRSGMVGLSAGYADNLTLNQVLSTQNNDERFNIAPVSGGAKIGRSRGIRVTNSSFSGNYGHGFWEDMSCYDSIIRQSIFSDNVGTGLFLEISAKAIVGDNLIAKNQEFGIKVNNTSNVKIWNNTFTGNGRPLNIVQDSRRNTNKDDQAVDKRHWPDPEMPWTLGPVTIRNNVVASSTSSANCLLCVEDYSKTMTAEKMKITANGNVYHRASSSQPTWLAVWSKGSGSPSVFTSLSAFRSATGQEKTGKEYVGTSIVDTSSRLITTVSSAATDVAEPLPSDIASAIGRPTGARQLGRW